MYMYVNSNVNIFGFMNTDLLTYVLIIFIFSNEMLVIKVIAPNQVHKQILVVPTPLYTELGKDSNMGGHNLWEF